MLSASYTRKLPIFATRSQFLVATIELHTFASDSLSIFTYKYLPVVATKGLPLYTSKS
jgi:hypothetical protein